MSFYLGKKSRSNLVGVHPDMILVVAEAIHITPVDFTVGEGKRTAEQQAINIENGVSWTMNSRHIPREPVDSLYEGEELSHAVDLWALANGSVTWAWPPYHQIAKAMKLAAERLGFPIVWGGDWSGKKADGPHFELDRKFYKVKPLRATS